MESAITSVNFCTLFIENIIHYEYIMLWLFGIDGFTWVMWSSKYWHISLYDIKKSPPASSEKSLSVEKLSGLGWWIQDFLISNFHLKSSNFYHWQQILLVAFHEVLPTIVSAVSRQISKHWIRQVMSQYYYKGSLTLQIPERVPGSQGA